MPGRHRAHADPSLKLPLAAGGAVVALVLAAATLGGLAGNDDGEADAMMAGHRMQGPSQTVSSTKHQPRQLVKKTPKPKPRPKPQRSKRAEPRAAKQTAKPKPPVRSCSTDLEGTQPHVAQVGNHVLSKFDVDSVGGRAGRAGGSDHPSGLALDFMVDTETGNAVADYVLQNRSDFGVTYVIWRQRYNDGSGWSTMEDRGSPTANHYDHVHVSFGGGGGVSVTC